MKKLFIVVLSAFLFSCGSGDSDSGGMATPTLPGTDVPANFAGVYNGTLNVTASALGITESDSFPISVTVTDDAMVRFDGDSPEETFTVALENGGAFRGVLPIDEDECTGTVNVSGTIDSSGTTASGTVEGSGRCIISGTTIDVELMGDFSATR